MRPLSINLLSASRYLPSTITSQFRSNFLFLLGIHCPAPQTPGMPWAPALETPPVLKLHAVQDPGLLDLRDQRIQIVPDDYRGPFESSRVGNLHPRGALRPPKARGGPP